MDPLNTFMELTELNLELAENEEAVTQSVCQPETQSGVSLISKYYDISTMPSFSALLRDENQIEKFDVKELYLWINNSS